MTDNAKRIFNFMKENHSVQMTAQEIAKELGVTINAVTGTVNGLIKKDYAVRTETETKDADGKTVVTKYVSLTDTGMAFDPDAEPEKK